MNRASVPSDRGRRAVPLARTSADGTSWAREGRFFSSFHGKKSRGICVSAELLCIWAKKRITVYLYGNTDTGAFTQLHYVRQFQEGIKEKT
jgi:hypothetical protein